MYDAKKMILIASCRVGLLQISMESTCKLNDAYGFVTICICICHYSAYFRLILDMLDVYTVVFVIKSSLIAIIKKYWTI